MRSPHTNHSIGSDLLSANFLSQILFVNFPLFRFNFVSATSVSLPTQLGSMRLFSRDAPVSVLKTETLL